MDLKQKVIKAVKNLIQRHMRIGSNGRFVYMKILNSVSELSSLASLEDLRSIKYIKEKSYNKIIDEIGKMDESPESTVKNGLSRSTDSRVFKNERSTQSTPGNHLNGIGRSQNISKSEDINHLNDFSELDDDSDSYLQNIKETYGKYLDSQPPIEFKYPEFYDDSSIILCTEIDQQFINDGLKTDQLNKDKLKTDQLNLNQQFINDGFNQKLQNEKTYDESNSSSDIVILDSNKLKMSNVFDDLDKVFDSFSDLTLDDSKNINSSAYKDEINQSNLSVQSISQQNLSVQSLSQQTSIMSSSIPLSSMVSSSILNTATPKKRKYIPGYRTASYAILKAIYQYNGSHKHLIVLKATPYTDAIFDRNQKFSAFSSFNTLQKKGLIHIDSDHKCHLTTDGIELCAMMFANDSFNVVEDNEIKIVIDSREKKSNRDRNFFQAYFSSKSIPNQTRHLVVGDFVWIKNERVIDYIVERKQTSDFVSSVSDGRYREQKNRLKNLGFNVFYIIENLKIDEARRNYINRCLLEVRLHGFVLIETESIQETADTLEKIDKMIRKSDGVLKDPISYGSFLDEGCKNNLTVQDMLLFSLMCVRGLSKDLAIGLSQEYKSICAFRNNMKTKDFKMKLSNFNVNGKIIGDKISSRIYSLFHIHSH